MTVDYAGYMRMRHATQWIATVDMDEMIEITRPDGVGIPHDNLADPSTAVAPTPMRLPEYLDSVPDHVTEIALMHCRLMHVDENPDADERWKWLPYGRAPPRNQPAGHHVGTNRRLVGPDEEKRPGRTFRNCRDDVPAGKSIGRAMNTPFSHIHFLFPSELPAAKGDVKRGNVEAGSTCKWLDPTAPSCILSTNYPCHIAKHGDELPFKNYGIFEYNIGVNHGGGKWLTNPHGYHGNATVAFSNHTQTTLLTQRIQEQLSKYDGGNAGLNAGGRKRRTTIETAAVAKIKLESNNGPTKSESKPAINGYERAHVFNQCMAGWRSTLSTHPPASNGADQGVAVAGHVHKIDVAYSKERRFVFMDNVKAGSSTIRAHLESAINVTWCGKPKHPTSHHVRQIGCQPRTKTAEFTLEELNAAFVFSFARDPVTKFESGVRQVWATHSKLKQYTADQILDMQLQSSNRVAGKSGKSPKWWNEHLQPTTWRLSGWASENDAARKKYLGAKNPQRWDGGPVDLNFIGALETFTDDWAEVVQHLTTNQAAKESEQRQLLQPLPAGSSNSRGERNRSKLSPSAIQRMCKSPLYKDEWGCLGYPSPCETNNNNETNKI